MTYLPILTYHRLLAQDPTKHVDPKRIAVSQDQFRKQLLWLKRLGYRTMELPAYIRVLRQGGSVPSRSFAVTFDDGYEEVLTMGLPVLKELGYTATVFAVAGQLGGSNVWDEGGAKLLTADQLRRLKSAGIAIGAHTCQHVHLTRVSPVAAKREIAESKQVLEQTLGETVTLFAYPYGETDNSVDHYAREAGFEAAFATDNAPRDHSQNLYRLRRVVVFPRNTVWEILMKVQTGYPAYQDWKRR
jgi:peptidoglycan/xylan/chitin deacetylase (PgdA/CDA1 family)